MANTNTLTVADLKVPSGAQIYNSLMSAIEPELLTEVIPTLDEKYKGETAEENVARMARYKAAYEKYDAAFQEWVTSLHAAVTAYRHDALKAAEDDDRKTEADVLSTLESKIS
jgi:Fe2+ transport system protein B